MSIKIDNSQTKVCFDFSPADYFLVFEEGFGSEKTGEYQWSLNPRIDRSEKGKDDDCGSPVIYLTDEEAEVCKKAGFAWINL